MIIDFRVRAPFKAYENNFLFTHLDRVEQDARIRVDSELSPSAKNFSLPALLEEAAEAGVTRMVVPVRRNHGNFNRELVELVEKYPDRFVGLAGINIADIEEAKEEIGRYVLEGPLKGIVLEPGQDSTPWFANSAWALPLYEFCEKAGVPVVFTFGGIMTKSLRYYDPLLIDDIAGAFPRLKIALCHGGWPHVTECCQIALNRGNVWLAPDLYMVRSPGMADYIMAANHLLRERIIFASAYPILPLGKAVEAYRNCGISEASQPYVMGKNAAAFLGLNIEEETSR